MSSLYPNFKTFLFQGKGVTGEVPFIKFDTDLKGLYLPATFTRPNSPEDPTESGATVIDADGTIRKLNEDEAPWSYPEGGASNGCLRLLNLPEKRNFFKTSDTASNPNNSDGSFQPNDWGIGLNGKVVFTQTGSTQLYYNTDVLNANRNYEVLLFAKRTDNSEPLFQGEAGTDDIRFRVGENLATLKSKALFKNNVYRVVLEANSGNSILNLCGLVKLTSSSSNSIEVSGIVVAEGIIDNYIPTSGSALTRNSSQIVFNDLVNKSVTGADGFSLFFDFDGYQDGPSNSPAIVLRSIANTIITLFTLDTGITPFGSEGTGYIDSGKRANSKFILTFDGQRVKFYYSGAKQIDGNLSTGGHVIDEIIFNSADNFYNIYAGSGVAPYVLPEATAAALTA